MPARVDTSYATGSPPAGRREDKVVIAFATLLFGVALLLAELAGFRFDFATDAWHLLSPDLLAHDMLRSLYLLHSQPPLLNLLTALMLKTAGLLSAPPAAVAKAVFLFLGWGTVCLLGLTVRNARSSLLLSMAVVLLAVANPAVWFQMNVLSYEIALAFLFAAGAWFLRGYLVRGRGRDFIMLSATVVTIVWLRSLYHPVWAVLTLAMAVLFRRSGMPRPSKKAHEKWVLAAAAVLLIAWPLKNYILFKEFSYSSWACYNLRSGPSEQARALVGFIRNGTVPEDVRVEIEGFKARHHWSSVPAVEAVEKSDGSRNWNHYVFLVENRGAWGRAVRYAARNPGRFLADAGRAYLDWSCPAYRNSYGDEIEGPDSAAYRTYASWIRNTLFRYVGAPGSKGVTVFGLVVFPALVAGLGWRIGKARRSGRDPEVGFIVILLFWVAWNLVVPALSDAAEISRIRFSMTPVLLILFALVFPRPRSEA